MRDYTIKYKKFDDLLNSVEDDFSTYDKNSLIEPSQLIKVVTKINKQLKLRVTKTKECISHFENNVCKLPEDTEHLNLVLSLTRYNISQPEIQGKQSENVSLDIETVDPDKEVFITQVGDIYEVIEKKKFVTYKYNIISKVELRERDNLLFVNSSTVEGVLKGEFLKLNIPSGYIYFNYEGMLEDEEGNLLVIDHPQLNDYYEYSLKRRILENLYFNGEETNMQNKLQLVEERWKEARKEARSVANMPDFKELQDTLDINRRAAHARYYSAFT